MIDDDVRVRSLGWVPISRDYVLRGKDIESDPCQREARAATNAGEDGASTGQERPERAGPPGGGAPRTDCHSAPEGTSSADTLFSDFWPPELWEKKF